MHVKIGNQKITLGHLKNIQSNHFKWEVKGVLFLSLIKYVF